MHDVKILSLLITSFCLSSIDKLSKTDDERMAEFIKNQVEREKLRKGDDIEEISKFTELKRSYDDEKINLGMKLNSVPSSSSSAANALPKNVFKSINKTQRKDIKADVKKRKAPSALEEIMLKEKEAKKLNKKSEQEDPWLRKNIMVKIISKSLGEKYHKQKGYVKEIIDEYCGIIVTNTGTNQLNLIFTRVHNTIVSDKVEFKYEKSAKYSHLVW